MNELKCPHCGKVFTVDADDYASIANQVRNHEFEVALQKQLTLEKQRLAAEENARKSQADASHQAALSQKDSVIQKLEADLKTIGEKKDLEYQKQLAEKDGTINALKSSKAADIQNAVLTEREQKNKEIADLRQQIEINQKDYEIKEKGLKDQYDAVIKYKDEEIGKYKEMKSKLSTKMVGETLEQHCMIQYEEDIRPHMPNAFFGKDNDASEGSKGDFIFRDKEDGVEYLSIMFEMKNENETTKTKHKNADFLAKLDEDRRKKNCDYAVLVSLLEEDNPLYNTGIVDMSHLYPKMYVIRPMFFKAIIRILMNAEKRTIPIRKELAVVRDNDRDFTIFEANVRRYAELFNKHRKDAGNNFKNALDSIDASIDQLRKVRRFLETSQDQLSQAQWNLDSLLDFKKVAKDAPSIQQKLEEARKANANPDEQ